MHDTNAAVYVAVDAEAGNAKVSKRSIELGRLSAGSGSPAGSLRKMSPGNSRRSVTASSHGVNLTTLLASRKSVDQPETPGASHSSVAHQNPTWMFPTCADLPVLTVYVTVLIVAMPLPLTLIRIVDCLLRVKCCRMLRSKMLLLKMASCACTK